MESATRQQVRRELQNQIGANPISTVDCAKH